MYNIKMYKINVKESNVAVHILNKTWVQIVFRAHILIHFFTFYYFFERLLFFLHRLKH